MRCALLALLLVVLVPGVARAAPLANTAHLDYLGETVSPPAQAGHSTYGAGPLGMLQATEILTTPAGWARTWPYGALLPWALSRSIWHGWGSQMPAALVASGHLAPALADSASFTPHLLIAGGPENGWNPSPTDGVQIAYGADSRLQSLLATGEHRPGLRRLASFAAAWYFGNNPAQAPMYDAATGRTYDGVARDGAINRNSGAESTIHGLLSMLALDAAPDVAAQARRAIPVQRMTWRMLDAESARLENGATVVTPPATWTGESAYSGAYVQGGRVTFDGVEGLVQPVAFRTADDSGGFSRWGALGALSHRDAGAQGASAIPGLLEVQTLRRPATGRVTATLGPNTQLDAILVQPLIESLTLTGQTLARSFDDKPRRIALPGRATSYDTTGRDYDSGRGTVVVPPGGFAIASG